MLTCKGMQAVIRLSGGVCTCLRTEGVEFTMAINADICWFGLAGKSCTIIFITQSLLEVLKCSSVLFTIVEFRVNMIYNIHPINHFSLVL
jgi:hypothetical protein